MDTNGLRVALVSPGWPPERRQQGIVTYTANLRSALRERGVRVFVLAIQVPAEHGDEDVVALDGPAASSALRQLLDGLLWRVARKFGRAVKRRRAAKRILRALGELQARSGIDALEMEETRGVAGLVALHSPVPIVMRLHGPWFLNGRAVGAKEDAQFYGRLRDEGHALRCVQGVSAPSHDVLRRVRSFYNVELPDAVVIPNAIQPAEPREMWSLAGCQRDRILFVGRFDRHKGGDVILDAIVRVAQDHPQVHLVFAGSDDGLVDEAGRRWQIAEYVRDRFPDAALRQRVEWLGAQPRTRLMELRREAMVTVVCSRYETFGYTAVEAMSQGCPLVATAAGGLAEIVQDQRNALVCRQGDPLDLAAKLSVLLANPELARSLGAKAATDCARRFHPDQVAERTLDFYRQVIARIGLASHAATGVPTTP